MILVNCTMKTLKLLIVAIFIFTGGRAQQIINIVLVDANGAITEDLMQTASFIVVKGFPHGIFQRLDYRMHAPIQKLRTYSDSLLEVLDGDFFEYAPNGSLYLKGFYTNNQKDQTWYYYNDTGKVVLKHRYSNGNFLEAINPDTVKTEPHSDKLRPGEKEAAFKGGDNAWARYIVTNLNAMVTEKSLRGGKVMVNFSIDTTGKPDNFYISKSTEFILDEEALRVVVASPNWQPAIQDGKHVRAYRRQPITFIREE